ncbi:MAG TPA: putative toxin, partial [Pirellulales bacterium]|nr:putative toxin [Pirellulales bacterium]
GSAAAIASFDQSNPSPWADLANWQAAALAIQQVGAAGAQLTQSTAQDNAQASEEQAQADATTAEDDAQAEAEATQTDSEAEAADAEALAQAETTEAVFTDLPDTLIAPSEGPAPTLAPDYQGGYEANDYYVHQTAGVFTQEWSLWGVGWEAFATAAPTFGGFASSAPLGTLDGNSVPDVAGGPYGVSIPFRQQDLVRNQLPQALNYQSAMHFSGGNAQLLELTDTPSNIGQGGYSQSPLPTTPASTQLANPVPVKSLSASLADVPAQAGSGGTSDGEGSSAAESGAEDTLPAKEQANVNNRTISADNARGQNSMQLRADKDMAWLLQLRARQADLSAIVSALTEDSGVVSRVSTGNGASKQWHTYDWSEALGYLKTTLKGLDANFAIATNTAAQAYNGTVGPGTSEEQLSNIAQTLDLVQAYVRVIHTAIWVSRNAPRNLGPAGFVNGAIDQANALYQSLESLKKGGSVNVDKVTTAAYSYLYDSVNKLGTAAALDWATKLFGAIVGVRGLLKAGATLLASVNGAPIGALEAVITQGGQIALRAKNGLIITLTQAQVEELAINGVVALEGGILVYSKAVDPNGLGRAAEAAVPGKQNTEHVPSPNQTADYRVPDRLSKVGLGEIKNHLRLSNTAQLKDYLKYAQQTGRTFTLWVRGNASGRQTILSGPLLDLVKQGKIIVKPIPGTGSWIQP